MSTLSVSTPRPLFNRARSATTSGVLRAPGLNLQQKAVPEPSSLSDSKYNHPWTVDHNALQSLRFGGLYGHVVLVLGEPTAKDLEPLLRATSLTNSLLLIATHSPPTIASTSFAYPTVYILRTLKPLAIHDGGALRLVSLFERAQRVANTWRKSSGIPNKLFQLAESEKGSEFTVVETFGFNPDAPNQPVVPAGPASRPNFLARARSQSTSSISQLRKKKPHTNHSQRAFDAIVNFVPSALEEKAILKQTILVTTLSQSFLAPKTPSTTMAPLTFVPPSLPEQAMFGDSSRLETPTPPRIDEGQATTPSSRRGSVASHKRYSSESGFAKKLAFMMSAAPSRSTEELAAPLSTGNVPPVNASHIEGGSPRRPSMSRRSSVTSRRSFIGTAPSSANASQISLTDTSSSSKHTHAHLIHVLPETYAPPQNRRRASSIPYHKLPNSPQSKLTHSIERFLLTFCHQGGSGSSTPSSGQPTSSSSRRDSGASQSQSGMNGLNVESDDAPYVPNRMNTPLPAGERAEDITMEKPVGFALTISTLAYVPQLEVQRHTNLAPVSALRTPDAASPSLVEMILMGAMDPEYMHMDMGTRGMGRTRADTVSSVSSVASIGAPAPAPRAWIGRGEDVVVRAGGGFVGGVVEDRELEEEMEDVDLHPMDWANHVPVGGLTQTKMRRYGEDFVKPLVIVTSGTPVKEANPFVISSSPPSSNASSPIDSARNSGEYESACSSVDHIDVIEPAGYRPVVRPANRRHDSAPASILKLSSVRSPLPPLPPLQTLASSPLRLDSPDVVNVSKERSNEEDLNSNPAVFGGKWNIWRKLAG